MERQYDEPDLRKHVANVLTDYKAGALDGLDDAVEAIMEHPELAEALTLRARKLENVARNKRLKASLHAPA